MFSRFFPLFCRGEDRLMIDHYPELGFLRDIVFLFKLLQSPTSDALPPIQQWSVSDSALFWFYKPDKEERTLVVRGYGDRQLKGAYVTKQTQEKEKSEGRIRGLLNLLGLRGKQPRLPPSCGNPSNLLDQNVQIEGNQPTQQSFLI
jgi:hypothetical protein